jgi:hypothetical protein
MVNNSRSQTKTIIEVVVAFILIIGVIIVLVNMGAFTPKAGTHRMTFRVWSAGGYANITLSAGDNHIGKAQTVTTPWEHTYDIASGVTVYVTAGNPTQTGDLSCFILLDNSEWKKSTISAPKDGVACAGIVP